MSIDLDISIEADTLLPKYYLEELQAFAKGCGLQDDKSNILVENQSVFGIVE